jgi:hypothetical protein
MPPQRRATPKPKAAGGDAEAYARLLALERLESLAEDMEELGVSTLDDLRRKIADLHAQLDASDQI